MNKLRKMILPLIVLICGSVVEAQIPYYGGALGKDKTYLYISGKSTEVNNEFYSTARYGVNSNIDLAVEYYSNGIYSSSGVGTKFNLIKLPSLNLGGQMMYGVGTSDSRYLSSGLYINGDLYGVDYVSNTFYDFIEKSVSQWTYLGYTGKYGTALVGNIFSYVNHTRTSSMALGVMIPLKNTYTYIWLSNLFNRDLYTRLTLGISISI